ncbi:MAG: hypothetical protein HY711_06525 [Candidatus Melainabacteria bacterium]|nr:hypothetical protein [Candidatus Melainabacteria bacterium]
MTNVMNGSDFMISDSPVDIDAGPGNLTLGGAGNLLIKAQGVLPGATFQTGIRLAGTQIIFSAPGTRTIEAQGSGIELRATSAAAPFPDLGSITLNISSVRLDGTSTGGDVAIVTTAGDLDNTAVGAINITLPSSAAFQARMQAAGRLRVQNVTVTNGALIMDAQGAAADSQVNNISVTGGQLRILAQQRLINLVGNILSTSTNLTNNGIFIQSGTGCVSCGSRITSSSGAVIRATGGNVVLSVVNSDKTNPGNYAMIQLNNTTVQATGYFNGSTAIGGGIALTVNDPTPEATLAALVALRNNDQPPNADAGDGTIQIDANPAQTASPSISTSISIGGTASASSNGIVRLFFRGEPNNIFFSGGASPSMSASGGALLVDGGVGSLPGNNAILFVNGLSVTATLPFSYTAPTGGTTTTTTTLATLLPPPDPDTTPSPDPTVIATDKTPPPTQTVPSVQREIERYENADIINQTLVSTNTCTAMSFNEMHDSYFLGECGTTFEVTGERSVLLKDGRMFAGAGKNGLRFRTHLADVMVAPKAMVLVSAMESKPLRVTNLDSPEPSAVEVQVNGEPVAQVDPGQEVLVGHELGEEELIAADGVERTPVGGTIQKFGVVAQKAAVPVGQLIERDMLLGCHSMRLGTAQAWPFKRLQELKVASTSPSGEPGSRQKALNVVPSPSANAKPFILTSYTAPGHYTLDGQGNWQLVAHVPSVAPQGLKLGPETDLSEIAPGHYRLIGGSVLTKSSRTTRLDTPSGVVVAKPNAAALVIVEDNLTRVLDLSDRASSDIRVLADRQYVDLLPGQEVGLIRGVRIDPKMLVSGDGLGRRRMRVIPGSGEVRVVVNEFSIVDALGKLSVLKGIRRSQDNEELSLLYQIMKTAAAVAMSTGKSSIPYSSQR